MLDRLERWLRIDSTTGNEARFLETLETVFTERDVAYRRQSVSSDDDRPRWNVIAERTPDPSLLFSTHVDTVPPHLPVRREGETIFGRGACDTKGGLVAMLEAARRLAEDGYDDFGFLLVVGEEVDHRGAKAARELELEPDRIILCEPTQNRVVAGQKGMIKARLTASGRAGHSAFPNEGLSAIHRLLESLQRIHTEQWPEDPLLGPTTLNVGTISGGVAANVFAPSAEAEVLFRTVSSSEPLIERLHALAGEGVEVEVVTYNDPVEFDPPDEVETDVVPFNTDATYLAELGPIWLSGPGDIRVAHSEDEQITLEQLREGVTRYESLARRVLGAP